MNIKKFNEIEKCDIFSTSKKSNKYLALLLEKNLIIAYNLTTNTISPIVNSNNNKNYYHKRFW